MPETTRSDFARYMAGEMDYVTFIRRRYGLDGPIPCPCGDAACPVGVPALG